MVNDRVRNEVDPQQQPPESGGVALGLRGAHNPRGARRQAFQRALDAACARAAARGALPRVLDIGAGSGLLALYAARARSGSTASIGSGAAVEACEALEPLAALARDVAAANGAGAAVRVRAVHSDALFVRGAPSAAPPGGAAGAADVEEAALGSQVDVIVTETADCGLLGEGMVPSLRRASDALLAPGGQVGARPPARARSGAPAAAPQMKFFSDPFDKCPYLCTWIRRVLIPRNV
jgi:predicted RNA methylase